MAAAKSDEIKAQVLAALLAGQGIRETARQFELSQPLISQWWKKFKENRDKTDEGADKTTVLSQNRADEFGDRILNVYRTGTTALEAVAKVALDQEWVRRQSAVELATFYGVVFDKCGRILESLKFDDSDSQQG